MRVLVVDDSFDVADTTADLMRYFEPKWQVATAETMESALQQVADLRPDAILLDIRMSTDIRAARPIDLIRRLLGHDVAIVGYTGDHTLTMLGNPAADGFDAMILKPAEVEDLIAAIRSLVVERA